MKTCSRCKVEKEMNAFYMPPSHRGRPMGVCKECQRNSALASYAKRREIIRAMTRTPEWRLKRKLRRCI